MVKEQNLSNLLPILQPEDIKIASFDDLKEIIDGGWRALHPGIQNLWNDFLKQKRNLTLSTYTPHRDRAIGFAVGFDIVDSPDDKQTTPKKIYIQNEYTNLRHILGITLVHELGHFAAQPVIDHSPTIVNLAQAQVSNKALSYIQQHLKLKGYPVLNKRDVQEFVQINKDWLQNLRDKKVVKHGGRFDLVVNDGKSTGTVATMGLFFDEGLTDILTKKIQNKTLDRLLKQKKLKGKSRQTVIRDVTKKLDNHIRPIKDSEIKFELSRLGLPLRSPENFKNTFRAYINSEIPDRFIKTYGSEREYFG